MTAAAILQFYAPFAGMLALSFWMGVLSQRVRQLEKGGDATKSLATDMAEVKTEIRHLGSSVDKLNGSLAWATTVAPHPIPGPKPAARRAAK